MDNLIKTLSETVGLPTIISAVIVCLIMIIVKKIKPKISPKTELIIRIIVSVIVRVGVILITKGEFYSLAESSLSVCGVSLIICAVFNKGDSAKNVKEVVSVFLPNVSREKIDEIFSALPEGQEDFEKVFPSDNGGVNMTSQNQAQKGDNRTANE